MSKRRRICMKRIAVVLAAVAVLMTFALPAHAVVDEIVAAYCSPNDVGAIDGVDLVPPGLAGGSNPIAGNFAAPVLNNGAVVVTDPGPPPDAEIGTSPSAKFPEGTDVLIDGVKQDLGDPDHISFEKCTNAES